MSPRTKTLKAKQIERVLRKMGFEAVRQKGSHKMFKHPDGRFTLIPFHGNEDIGRGLLPLIMREINSTPEGFSKLL